MINIHIGAQEKTASLMGAILLYGAGGQFSSGQAVFATIHDMQDVADQPVIGPGRHITEADLADIHKSLANRNDAQSNVWLDQSILVKGPDRLVWWTPPAKRAMFFKASKVSKNSFEGSGVCPVPGLVWMAIPGRGLYVFATSEPERPTQATRLYQAPFFNVWGRGRVCVGSAKEPEQSHMWEPKAWEAFFFGSHFSHPNFGQKDRLIKGMTPVNFWKKMVAKPQDTFPVERLVQMPLTAGDLTSPVIVDKLNALPKPKGEF